LYGSSKKESFEKELYDQQFPNDFVVVIKGKHKPTKTVVLIEDFDKYDYQDILEKAPHRFDFGRLNEIFTKVINEIDENDPNLTELTYMIT